MNDDSILTSVKKMLGIPEEYEHFDTDLIIHINSVFMILTQMGVGPSNGFSISNKQARWSEFIGDARLIESVRTYMYLKVRLIFDPPTSSAVTEAINRLISEFEWRLNVSAETPLFNGEEVQANG